MWLVKDERRLLAGYYTQIREIGTEKVYRFGDLKRLLCFRGHRSSVPEYGDSVVPSGNSDDVEALKHEAARYIDDSNRIKNANNLLAARGLITATPHQHEMDVVVIGLLVEGYDLGRRYSHPLESSGLWFQEYRNHWIWLILAFFGGAVGAKLIDWMGTLIRDA